MLLKHLADWIVQRVLLIVKGVRFALLLPKHLNVWLCGRAVRAAIHPSSRGVSQHLVLLRLFVALITTVVLVTFAIVRISMKVLLCAVRWPPMVRRMLPSQATRKN